MLFERELALEEREMARLLELLDDERSVLTRHEDELLLGIAAEKSKHLASLERYAERRSRFLADQGYSPDHTGMLEWLAAHPDCATCAQAWGRLEHSTRAAREINEVNGDLIAGQVQRFQRQLGFLNAMASNDPTYSPDGYSMPRAPQRTFGEA